LFCTNKVFWGWVKLRFFGAQICHVVCAGWFDFSCHFLSHLLATSARVLVVSYLVISVHFNFMTALISHVLFF
jgi:hypothetical protein